MELAVIGDIHGRFDDEDVRQLDARGYDAVLFVGDLGGFRPGSTEGVAEAMSRLRTPAYVVPGNHDAVTKAQQGAELTGMVALAERLGAGMADRVTALRALLGPVQWSAYTRHDLGAVQLVTGRPHAYGGRVLGFAGHLARAHGVSSMRASAERLMALLDACDARPIVVLAHNGPRGLGDRRDAIFGRDFHPEQGDWGDPDLHVALEHARRQGKRVVAVAAGHMHHALSGGGQRTVGVVDRGTVVINAARVPRVDREGWRHHVLLTVRETSCTAEAVWWRDDQERRLPIAAV